MFKKIVHFYLAVSAIGWCFYGLLYFTLGVFFSPYPISEILLRILSVFLMNTIIAAIGVVVLGTGYGVGLLKTKPPEPLEK